MFPGGFVLRSVMTAGVLLSLTGLGSTHPQGAPAANPIPYGTTSVARGRASFLQNCAACHGEDGRAQGSAIAIAADLTRPESWKHGTTDLQLFTSIRNGAGDAMPPFGPIGQALKDSEIWDLVNFIRSIGPEELRPSQ